MVLKLEVRFEFQDISDYREKSMFTKLKLELQEFYDVSILKCINSNMH